MWRREASFSLCMSTVLRGEPFCSLTTTILCIQSVGLLAGTFSRMPSSTSLKSYCLTSSTQCTGLVAGLWIACGTASGLRENLRGGPVILGRGWWEHMFTVEEE